MGSMQVEVERKYDVPSGAAVPPLAGVGPVASVDEPVTQHLEAVYHDTADLALARARTTLRRRTGGGDSGWHLKRPEGTARSERHEPLGDADGPVPEALLEEVRAVVRDHPVEPVATLRTRRVVHRLRGEDGTVLAELADDTVTAHSMGRRRGCRDGDSWREWEVELVEGDAGLLEAVEGRAARGGGRRPRQGRPSWPAPSPGGWPSCPARRRRSRHATGRRGTGGAAVPPGPARTQVVGHDPGVRAGGAEDVHKMRVATRRTAQRSQHVPPVAGPRGDRPDARRAEVAGRRPRGGPRHPGDVGPAGRDGRGGARGPGHGGRARRHGRRAARGARAAQAAATEALGPRATSGCWTPLDELVRQPPWTPLALGPPRTCCAPGSARSGSGCAAWRQRRRRRAGARARRAPARGAQGGQAAALRRRGRRAGVRGQGRPAWPPRPRRSRRCSAT